MKISVIIPFFNEEENIPALTTALNTYFSEQNAYTVEVIFVNDGSIDASVVQLKNQKHIYYTCKLVSFSKNFGSHAALRAGIQQATGDYITFIYADLQDPIELITKMYDTITQSKCDIVWATRKSTENGLAERIFSSFYSVLMKKYVSTLYPTKGFDIVFFSKKVAGILNYHIEANSSIFLQILTLGFQQVVINYNKLPRQVGKSKWTLRKKIKLFIDSFVAFSFAPIRFVTFMGITFFILGILWSSYIIIRKLLIGDLDSGWPTLISVLLLGFGITNISLGIIAEYLWRTLDVSRKRPVFIIDEIIDLKNEY